MAQRKLHGSIINPRTTFNSFHPIAKLNFSELHYHFVYSNQYSISNKGAKNTSLLTSLPRYSLAIQTGDEFWVESRIVEFLLLSLRVWSSLVTPSDLWCALVCSLRCLWAHLFEFRPSILILSSVSLTLLSNPI